MAISREKLDPGPGGNDWVDICNNGDNSRHCMLEEKSPSRLGVGKIFQKFYKIFLLYLYRAQLTEQHQYDYNPAQKRNNL